MSKLKITLYKADWCGHCKNFQETWEKIQEYCKTKNVDCETFTDPEQAKEISKAGVSGFPTIMFEQNNIKEKHSGSRDYDDLIKIIDEKINKQTGSGISSNIDYKKKYLKYKAKYLRAIGEI
jgi:glutaredoxin